MKGMSVIKKSDTIESKVEIESFFCQPYFSQYRGNGSISNAGTGVIDSNCDYSAGEHA